MVDEDYLDEVVACAKLNSSDVLLEVGAGYGGLTEKLSLSNKVSAIENDKDLFHVLEGKFSSNPNVELIFGDALKVEYPIYNKIVSNIPYSISRDLVERFILEGFSQACLVTQREFAEKLMARPDTEFYRMISVLVQSTCGMEVVSDIPAKAFRPQPKVESRLIRLTQNWKPGKDYIVFLNRLFSQQNKKLRNILDVPPEYSELRPVEMRPETIRELYQKL